MGALTQPVERASPGPAARGATATALHQGLRLAVLGICVIVLCLQGAPRMLWSLNRVRSPAGQITAYGVCLAVVVVGVGLAARNRSWGRACWPAAGAVLGSTVVSWLSLPSVSSSADWHYGLVGWLGIVIFFDRRLWVMLGFIATHVGASAVLAVTATDLNATRLLALATVSVEIVGLQIAVAAGTVVLRRLAARAEAAASRQEETLVREHVSTEVHADRLRRYQELDGEVLPLLAGLESGDFDPADPGVQLRCAIEAARLRRMFAETDDSADPLLNEARAAADPAVRRGVIVSVEKSGETPSLPRHVRRGLIDPLVPALVTAARTARVTLTSNDQVVSASVVTDLSPGFEGRPGTDTADATEPADQAAISVTHALLALDGHDRSPPVGGAGHIDVTTIRGGGTQWVQTQWSLV